MSRPAARLPQLRPADLTEAQRKLYTELTGGPRAGTAGLIGMVAEDGTLAGPFAAMLVSPAIGQPLQALGAAIRFHSHLTERQRELAILTVAAHWDSSYERYAHERIAATLGITEAELCALREGDPEPFHGADRWVVEVVSLLLAGGAVTQERFNDAQQALGTAALVDLAALAGYYTTLAWQLRLFEVGAPEPVGAATGASSTLGAGAPGRSEGDPR